jgi:hypothetical protein
VITALEQSAAIEEKDAVPASASALLDCCQSGYLHSTGIWLGCAGCRTAPGGAAPPFPRAIEVTAAHKRSRERVTCAGRSVRSASQLAVAWATELSPQFTLDNSP